MTTWRGPTCRPWAPVMCALPRLDLVTVEWRGRAFGLPYLYRAGTDGPAVLFVHGLGGAKENFYAAFQSPALATCTLVAFDTPGTGQSAFHADAGLDVSALADLTQLVADHLLPGPYYLVGASMGGLHHAAANPSPWVHADPGPDQLGGESERRGLHVLATGRAARAG